MFELEISAPTSEVGAEQHSELQRIDATFDSFQEFVAETAPHLTAKSVFLATPEKLPAGTAVRLEVALTAGTALIRALGQIASPHEPEEVDGSPADPAADQPPGLDIRFTYLDPASARVIDSVSRLGRWQELAAETAETAAAAGIGESPEESFAEEVAPPTAEAEELDDSPPPEVLAPEELAPSLGEGETAAEPEEKSWELEVDSLLSEVLPEAGESPPSAAGASEAEVAAEPAEPSGFEPAAFDLPEPPATFAEELPEAPFRDLPLRAPDAAAIGAEVAAEEVLPAIDLGSSASPPGEVQLAGADDDDSLVLGFGESITMAPPKRRSTVLPLLLLFAGVAAIGLFFYLRGARLPGSGEVGVVAELPPAAGVEAVAPETGNPAAATEPPPTAEAPPPAAEPPPPAVTAPPPPLTAPPPPATAPPPPAVTAPPPTAPTASGPAATEAVEGAVKAWAAAWTAQRVDDYLASYSPEYSPPGLGRREWEEQRRVRVRAPKEIQVNLSNFSIELLDASRAQARFLQHYATESRNLKAWKIMELERRRSGWKIVSEKVDRR